MLGTDVTGAAKRSHRTASSTVLFHLALLAGCAALSGCDILYGVRRTASVEPPTLSVECVRSTIASTPGVASVEVASYPNSSPSTGGLLVTESVFYRGSAERIYASMGLNRYRDGRLDVQHAHFMFNHRPDQADIDASRALMTLVERRIAEACDVPRFRTPLVEKCSFVNCPQPPAD